MNFFSRFVVLAAGLSLAGCFNNGHIEVAEMTPTGTEFQAALHQGYSELAAAEYGEGDWHDGYGFQRKARLSAEGETVDPEFVWDWDIPEDLQDELYGAWDGLGFWMRMGAAERQPALMAKAQVSYDCWLQEQEENTQTDDIAACRNGYYGAIADLDKAMTWEADPPDPMAMPGPTPRPAVEEPIEVAPRFYTIFFDWDESDINPIAERVIDAISIDWIDSDTDLELIGHADRSGGDEYNQALSERRATSVTDALSAGGISGSRLSGYGLGESDPAIPTPDGVREPRNRRVIVKVR
jgi:outer membrane protein OmpA-like peptidoglycan-associated protein